MTDLLGDGLGNAEILRCQVNIVGDERMARPDDGGPGGAQPGGAKVRLPYWVRCDLHFEPFILPMANVLKVGAFRAGGGFLVQIDRDIQFPANAVPQAARHLDALFHADIGYGHKRHHVCSTQAWVGTAVLVKVDQPGGCPDGPECRFFDWRRWAGECDHAAVMIGVGTVVKQGYFSHAGDGCQDGSDHFRATGF